MAHPVEQFEWIWSELIHNPYRRDAFSPYLCDRCLCDTLHPLSNTWRAQKCKELTNNPGQKGAFWLEGRVGAVWVRVAGSWGLRWGNFSPLIALCGTSPGGTLTAVEAGVYDLLSEKPLAKRPSTTDKNLTYCSKTMWEINNKSNFLPKKENKKQISNSLFISQDDYDLL